MKILAHERKTPRLSVHLVAITSLAAASLAQAAEYDVAYSMTVISDESYGYLVKDGDYDEAIDKIANRSMRRAGSFEAQTNLCVAYTKSGDLENAQVACNNAVDEIQKRAERPLNRHSTPEHYVDGYRAFLALAYANRGVLSAVRGNSAEARADFLRASELNARLPTPAEINLARLERGSQAGRP